MTHDRFVSSTVALLLSVAVLGTTSAQRPLKRENPFKELSPATKVVGDPVAKPGEIPLPSQVSAVVAGRGGDVLILHMAEVRQIAIYDVREEKLSKLIPVSDDVLFAAGKNVLLIADQEKRVLERWNLPTLRRELSTPFPTDGRLHQMAMGSAANDRAFLAVESDRSHALRVLNVESMKLHEETYPLYSRFGKFSHDRPYMRVSPLGNLLITGGALREVTPKGLRMVDHAITSLRGTLSNHDGSVLYTDRMIFTTALTANGQRQTSQVSIPSVQPGFYLSISDRTQAIKPAGVVTVHVEGDQRPLVALPEIDLSKVTPRDRTNPAELELHEMFWHLPDANVVVQLPKGKPYRLVSHRLNIREQLEQLGVDYLYVTSRAPIAATVAKPYQYQVNVESKHGGVVYSLVRAPAGMTIDKTGKISWDIPKDVKRAHQSVDVRIKDESGQDLVHRFTFRITERYEAELKKLAEAERSRREASRLKAQREANSGRALRLERSGEQVKAAIELRARSRLRAQSKQPRAGSSEPMRWWTDTDGNRIQGRLAGVFAGKADLLRSANRTMNIEIDRLSEGDQEYIRSVSAKLRRQQEIEQAMNADATAPLDELRILGQAISARYAASRKIMSPYTTDPSGKPLLSWRVHLLPALGGQELYRMFNLQEPWDSEHNRKLLDYMPSFYRSPKSKAEKGKTNFLAVMGKQSAVQHPQEPEKVKLPIAFPVIANPQDITQPFQPEVAATALVIEVSDEAAVEWTRPDDWQFEDAAKAVSRIQFRDSGVFLLRGDGTVTLANEATGSDMIEQLFSIDHESLNNSK